MCPRRLARRIRSDLLIAGRLHGRQRPGEVNMNDASRDRWNKNAAPEAAFPSSVSLGEHASIQDFATRAIPRVDLLERGRRVGTFAVPVSLTGASSAARTFPPSATRSLTARGRLLGACFLDVMDQPQGDVSNMKMMLPSRRFVCSLTHKLRLNHCRRTDFMPGISSLNNCTFDNLDERQTA